jgi:predicted ATPase
MMIGNVIVVENNTKGIPKVVITGGPCGGKTTIIRLLSKKYQKEMKTIPEYASFVIKKKVIFNEIELQKTVYSLYQNIYEKYSNGSYKKHSLLISDRGSLDGAAYYKDYFNLHRTSTEQEYKKYDLVIFLESISKFSKNIYEEHIDSRRTESFESARDIDNKLYNIWKDHGNFVLINDHSLSIYEKFKIVDETIFNFLNQYNKNTK